MQARIASGDLTASQGLAILAGNTVPAAAAPTAKPDAQTLAVLDQVSATLRDLLDAQVRVTTTTDNRRRITIDVPTDDLARILQQLGVTAAA